MAFSLSSISYFFIILYFLHKKVGDFGIKGILTSLKKIMISTLLMLIVTYVTLRVSYNFFDLQRFVGVFFQTCLVGFVGVAAYILISLGLNSRDVNCMVYSILKKAEKNT